MMFRSVDTMAVSYRCARFITGVALVGITLGGCAQNGPRIGELTAQRMAIAQDSEPKSPSDAKSELQRATEYWAKEYLKNPADPKNALAYAKNLKALGEKRKALSVLQHASSMHSGNREVMSEYGRLALEHDQITIAEKALAFADDATKPDWRVVSARGVVMAKQGRASEAIAFLERARALAPHEPSIGNNLALAYAMKGEAKKAENLLKTVNARGPDSARVHQNLALVLGLQGKYDEAKKVAAKDVSPAVAESQVASVREMVRLPPQSSSEPAARAPAVAGWSTQVKQGR